jgi:hypothetical protein
MKTVEQLRKSGYKVKVEHYRTNKGQIVQYSKKTKGKVDPKGGLTVVTVTTPSGRTLKSNATCHQNDVFSYKVGVKIALGRVLNRAEEADNSAISYID